MVEIIAEAAQGYYRDNLNIALTLTDMASAAGADAIKFQLVYADELCTQDYKHFEIFDSLYMSNAEWQKIADRCTEKGISLYLDVFGLKSLELALKLGVKGIKLHSTDLLNLPLIKALAKSNAERVLLGTGGTHASEISQAMKLLDGKDIVLLHGFQGYPTANKDNQISRLALLGDLFPGATIGFADHVPEDDPARLWLSAAAIGAGASVIEKHITRSLVLRDEDCEAALNPDDFSAFVENMRLTEKAVGLSLETEDFGMSKSEDVYRKAMKKQVVAKQDLEGGRTIDTKDITMIRTSDHGDLIYDLDRVLGRTLTSSKTAGSAFKETDFS